MNFIKTDKLPSYMGMVMAIPESVTFTVGTVAFAEDFRAMLIASENHFLMLELQDTSSSDGRLIETQFLYHESYGDAKDAVIGRLMVLENGHVVHHDRAPASKTMGINGEQVHVLHVAMMMSGWYDSVQVMVDEAS